MGGHVAAVVRAWSRRRPSACIVALLITPACTSDPADASARAAAPAERNDAPPLSAAATTGTVDVKSDVVAIETVRTGGITVSIPAPTSEFVAVGSDHRGVMEVFAPASNRLVTAFVLAQDLPLFATGFDQGALSEYALVEVPRREEFSKCSDRDFKEVTAGAEKQFGHMSSVTSECEEEFNRRMKALALDEQKIAFGKVVQIGCLFSRPDAYGFGMIIPVSVGKSTMKMGMGGAMVRVGNRLLFIYVYAEYRNEETVIWLRTTTDRWVDAILQANRDSDAGQDAVRRR